MDFITGQGGGARKKGKVRNLASSLSTILFSSTSFYYLQTVPVCNPYAQINLLSGKGETDQKGRPVTAQWKFTGATAAEVNHDLVCAFIEVSAVY